MFDFIKDIEKSIKKLDFLNDPEAYNKREELKAMKITANAIRRYSWRHGYEAGRQADLETDPKRKKELKKIAEVCQNVPDHQPKTFHEALQAYWFIHLGVIIEANPWDSFSPGKLDQHLYPFYKKEIEAGTLSKEMAKEILQSFWIKFNNHT